MLCCVWHHRLQLGPAPCAMPSGTDCPYARSCTVPHDACSSSACPSKADALRQWHSRASAVTPPSSVTQHVAAQQHCTAQGPAPGRLRLGEGQQHAAARRLQARLHAAGGAREPEAPLAVLVVELIVRPPEHELCLHCQGRSAFERCSRGQQACDDGYCQVSESQSSST